MKIPWRALPYKCTESNNLLFGSHLIGTQLLDSDGQVHKARNEHFCGVKLFFSFTDKISVGIVQNTAYKYKKGRGNVLNLEVFRFQTNSVFLTCVKSSKGVGAQGRNMRAVLKRRWYLRFV